MVTHKKGNDKVNEARGRLFGKTAIVIGGGQRKGIGVGNGRAICTRFAEEGANVLIVARHLDSALGTINYINEKYRSNCSVFAGDISNEQSVLEMFSECKKQYGKIDILVNNVGEFKGDSSFFELDFDNYENITQSNVRGAMYCFRHIYPYMKERGGSIIQVSSIAGSMIVRQNLFTYAMSKHSMKYLGEIMAATYAKDGIRVNNIILGYVNTPLVIERGIEAGKKRDEVIEERNKTVPLKGGAGDAWDTANAALFLASDEAKFITGASLPVDGGALVCGGRC